jgi:hypothetical protein
MFGGTSAWGMALSKLTNVAEPDADVASAASALGSGAYIFPSVLVPCTPAPRQRSLPSPRYQSLSRTGTFNSASDR